jgi:hypothetical protein
MRRWNISMIVAESSWGIMLEQYGGNKDSLFYKIVIELKNSYAIGKIKRKIIRRVEMCLKIRAGTCLIHDLRYNIRKLLKPQDVCFSVCMLRL